MPNPLDVISPGVIGKRLQEARKTCGMTQQAVAEALGFARTTVTAIEKGERRVQALELAKFAELYGRPVAEIVRPQSSDVPLSVELRASFGAKLGYSPELREVVYELEQLAEDFVELERLNGVSTERRFPSVYPIGTAPDVAGEEAALEERRRLALGDGPLMNLRDVLEYDVGLRVFYLDMPSQVAGMFGYTQDLGGCIAVNRKHPPERRRLSIAHEYAHFMCSREEGSISRVGTHRVVPLHERFANAFSYALLMPASGLNRRVRDIKRGRDGRFTVADLCHLAHFYFVSEEALALRLEGLDLLPVGTWDRLKQGGLRLGEARAQLGLPAQAEADHMLPQKYVYLAAEAFANDQITKGRLAQYLRTDRITAQDMVKDLSQPEHVRDDGGVERIGLDLSRTLPAT